MRSVILPVSLLTNRSSLKILLKYRHLFLSQPDELKPNPISLSFQIRLKSQPIRLSLMIVLFCHSSFDIFSIFQSKSFCNTVRRPTLVPVCSKISSFKLFPEAMGFSQLTFVIDLLLEETSGRSACKIVVF